jgi:hypothetical protein
LQNLELLALVLQLGSLQLTRSPKYTVNTKKIKKHRKIKKHKTTVDNNCSKLCFDPVGGLLQDPIRCYQNSTPGDIAE